MANTFTQLVSDSFPQANENPLSSGGNWTANVTSGAIVPCEVISNTVQSTVIGGAASGVGWYTGISWPNDQYAEVTVSADSTSCNIGAQVRSTSGADTCYRLAINGPLGATATARLSLRNAGAVTTLVGPTTITASVGDVFRIAVIGTTLTCYQNGTLISGFTATDATLSSGVGGLDLINITSIANSAISEFAGGSVYSGTVSSVGLSPSTVTYPTTSTGTVTLSANAPTGGIVVTLTSGTTATATVPASVTVLAGASTATFTVTSQNVGVQGTSLITASISGGSSASATITVNPEQTVATPTFSPIAGTYSNTQNITISTTTPGASIFYTTDGSTPTTGSTPYSGPVSVSVSLTLKAIATASGFINSAVGSSAYVISSTPGTHYSVPDARNYGNFPNLSTNVNGTLTYTVPKVYSLKYWFDVLFNRTQPLPEDCRAAGAPVASGTYPQNSRAPGTYGPGE